MLLVNEMKKILLRVALIVAIVLWMVTIFSFSAETADASSATSRGVIKTFVKFLYSDFESLSAEQQFELVSGWQGFVRETAHLAEYAILGFLVSGFMATLEVKRAVQFSVPPLWCLAYAVTDEVHQLFVDGRAFQLLDLLIDCSGGILGTAALFILILLVSKVREKKNGKKNNS